MLLTACEKGFVDDGASTSQVKNSVLQVRTRGSSPGEEATVAYPLQVYVFQGDECKALQTIGDKGQTLNIALTEGAYTVYAVGGASSTDYVLPSADDATTTTAIALREGHGHGDLMTAQATATLVDGGTNTVTLGLQRKTMLMQSITINKVPTAATAVSVTIAPLWQSLTVGGGFATAGTSRTIALTKQSDNRTWLLPSPVGEGSGEGLFLLPPSSQPASISVNITIGGTTKTYTYSCSDELEAGYRINIVGTYTEAVGVRMTGTITGATWQGERTISFDFNESGSSASPTPDPSPTGAGNDDGDPTPTGAGNDDGSPSPTGAGSIPQAGDTYEGCYVLAVTLIDEHSAELTLLSPNERTVTSANDANNALATLGVDGISDWSIPTEAQMNAFYAAKGDVKPAPAGQQYLWQSETSLKVRHMSDGSDGGVGYFTSIYLRPVATVTINNE